MQSRDSPLRDSRDAQKRRLLVVHSARRGLAVVANSRVNSGVNPARKNGNFASSEGERSATAMAVLEAGSFDFSILQFFIRPYERISLRLSPIVLPSTRKRGRKKYSGQLPAKVAAL